MARKVYKKPTKRHYCDNNGYCDILMHDNRHQLFLISPIPTPIAKQGLSRGIPRHNHAVCTFQVHSPLPPTSPCPPFCSCETGSGIPKLKTNKSAIGTEGFVPIRHSCCDYYSEFPNELYVCINIVYLHFPLSYSSWEWGYDFVLPICSYL